MDFRCIRYPYLYYLPQKPNKQLGNRLTRRPCKGDEFEIRILEAQRQDAGICITCEKGG